MVDVVRGGLSGNALVNAVMLDKQWHWTDLPTYGLSQPVLTYFLDGSGGGGAWNGAEVYLMNQVFDSLGAVINIRFEQVYRYDDAQLVERKQTADFFDEPDTMAWHDTPDLFLGWFNDDQIAGDFNVDDLSWKNGMFVGGDAFYTMLHEVMHGLGLDHTYEYLTIPGVVNDGDLGQFDLDQYMYSVMSYNTPWENPGGVLFAQSDMRFGGVLGPSAIDIAALQYLYGANTNYHRGNDTYLLPDVDGVSFLQGTGFQSIWDASGIDEIAYNGSNDTEIDLNPASLAVERDGGGSVSKASGVHGGFTIAQGVEIENARGGSGIDEIYGNYLDNWLWGNDGKDKLFGAAGVDHLFGGRGNDTLFGGGENDFLYGDDDNDTLNGEGGDDAMDGGIGDDNYAVDQFGDQVFEVAGDGGGTRDKIYTTLPWYDLRPWDKGEWVEELQFVGAGEFHGYGNALNNYIVGGANNDLLYGFGGNDTLAGGGGSDTLDGGADDDRLIGAGDAYVDTLIGSTGDDTYVVGEGDQVIEDLLGSYTGTGIARRYLSSGIDTVETALHGYKLGPNVENLTFTDNPSSAPIGHTGDGNELNNVMRGSGGRDMLTGFAGNDTLDGGAGADWMYGGIDNDIYVVDNPDDLVAEWILNDYGIVDAGSIDEVRATLPFYRLSEDSESQIEYLTYIGTDQFVGVGNSLDNILKGGNAGDDTHGDRLSGGGGNDYLYGFDGGDTLDGGAGADGMAGGRGNDIFIMDNGTEVGGDVVAGEEGIDEIRADESVADTGLHLNLFAEGTPITAEVNLVPYTSAAVGVEYVTGSSGNDRVDASRIGGADGFKMLGLAGDDTLIRGGKSVMFDGGENFDTMVFAGAASNYSFATPASIGLWQLDSSWVVISDHTTGNMDAVREVEIAKFADSTTFTFATGNWSPTVRTVADQSVVQNEWHRLIDWVTATDANTDAITQYQFKEDGTSASSGYFSTPSNAHHEANSIVAVNAGDLDKVWFRGGQSNGTETLSVQAFDGKDWSEWRSFNVTTRSNAAPEVAVADHGVRKYASLAASSLFTASDADGDAITQYHFWDSTTEGTSGHFAIDGVAQGAMQAINVSAAQLAQTTFQTGTTADDLWVQVFDGMSWSDWKEFHLTPPVGETLIGTAGSDTLTGGVGNDRLEGRDGTDFLTGGAGADQLLGGAGSDFLYVDADDTLIDGGEGFDYAYLDTSKSYGATFKVAGTNVEYVGGTSADDVIDASGVAYRVVLNGNYGRDVLIGGAGNDGIDGSANDDTLTGGGGNDTFYFATSSGRDTVTDFTDGQDVLDMTGYGAGLTSISQLAITSTAQGASIAFGGNSILLQGVAANSLNASDFRFTAAPAATLAAPGQTLIGTAGSDTLTGGNGNDRLEGRDGTDFLTGGAGADQLLGGAGSDFLYVDADDTVIDGGEGFDYAYLDTSKSYGATFKVAGTNVEYVGGTLADDVIDATGVSYGTILFGNYGRDVLIGGAGNDRLQGSTGDDILTGGAGNDTFCFAAYSGRDTVTDFTDGQDVLNMSGYGGLTSIVQLAITDTAQGAVIAYGGDSIVLQGVAASMLSALDFQFLT